MADLKNKIQDALNEARILILGAQVLLGFQFRAPLEQGFDKLPPAAQQLKLGGLGLLMVTIGLLMLPAVYHRVVAEGEDTPGVHRFTSTVTAIALLPFALALAGDFFVAFAAEFGDTVGLVASALALATALGFWYGIEVQRRQAHGLGLWPSSDTREDPQPGESKEADMGTKTETKISQVLTEARVVLPGAQALLGFQLAGMLTDGFDKLPSYAKYVHLGSLAAIGVAVVLLMAPAAYHRIVTEGEATEGVHRFASAMVLGAMVPLALGICGDVFVVVDKVTRNTPLSVGVAAAGLVFFYGLWFGLTLALKARRTATGEDPRGRRSREEAGGYSVASQVR